MTDIYTYDIHSCDKCDISVGCHFKPGKGEGTRDSVIYIFTSQTTTDYKKGIGHSIGSKIIKKFNDYYNFNAYYTSLIKCPTTNIVRTYEINNCIHYLKKEINIVNPKIIVSIGDTVTSQFINYKYFREVVDKPHILNLNNKTVILYPIYAYSNKSIDLKETYVKSFLNLAKLYKAFINPNYLCIDLI